MSLIATWVEDLYVASNLDKNENKGNENGAKELFMVQTNAPDSIVSADMKAKVLSAHTQTVNAKVLKYNSGLTIGSDLPAVIVDELNTSAYLVITPVTYSFGFTQVPTDFANNEVAMQEDFNFSLTGFLNLLATTIDQACVSALATDKTQVFNNLLDYTNVGNLVTASLAKGDDLIGDLTTIQSANDFTAQQYLVGNYNIQSRINKLAEHGTYNDQMKNMKYQDKILTYTNNIANAATYKGTGYLVNSGSVGLVQGFERQALAPQKKALTGHTWGIAMMPIINMMMSTYYYEGVDDQSSLTGAASADNERAIKRHYGFAMNLAIVTSYNSDLTTITNPITGFQISES